MLLLFVLDSCVFFFFGANAQVGCACVCVYACNQAMLQKQTKMRRDNRAVNMQDVWFCQCLNLGCGQFVSFMLNGYYFHLFDSRI